MIKIRNEEDVLNFGHSDFEFPLFNIPSSGQLYEAIPSLKAPAYNCQ